MIAIKDGMFNFGNGINSYGCGSAELVGMFSQQHQYIQLSRIKR